LGRQADALVKLPQGQQAGITGKLVRRSFHDDR
jgi:hypothetical protein